MKAQTQIEGAHKLLTVALDKFADDFPTPEDLIRTRVALAVLCWVLDHPHENKFDAILASLDPLKAVMESDGLIPGSTSRADFYKWLVRNAAEVNPS